MNPRWRRTPNPDPPLLYAPSTTHRVRELIPNGVPPDQIAADLQASGATKEGKYVRADETHSLVYHLRTHLHNRIGEDRWPDGTTGVEYHVPYTTCCTYIGM